MSQFNSFLFNESPTEHVSCTGAPAHRPELGITHPYPCLPIRGRLGPPKIPQGFVTQVVDHRVNPSCGAAASLALKTVEKAARVLNCARTGAIGTKRRHL